MKRRILNSLGLAILLTTLWPAADAAAQRRRVVVTRPRPATHRPVRHTRVVVHTGHPLRRALPDRVVVRPARKTVVVGAPPVFLPAVTWTAAAATLPARERLVWEDTEVITRDEGWVDTNFGVDERGDALFLRIGGSAQLSFAEVAFDNGNVQVVDFNDRTHGDGIYRLLDFADGHHVKTVRLLAKSKQEETKLSVYLSK
ncbi:MAG TPA: hypothetical protein VFZ44_14060 [Pyrinomonadaceae bacterium]